MEKCLFYPSKLRFHAYYHAFAEQKHSYYHPIYMGLDPNRYHLIAKKRRFSELPNKEK